MLDNMISLYETRRMVGVLRQMEPNPQFFRRFQTNTLQHPTDTITIDIEKGGQRIVPYVFPVQEGVVMERAGYTTESYKIPYIRVKMTSEADKFLTRSANETVFDDGGPASRAARQLVDDLDQLHRNIEQEEERQRAEAFTLGQTTIRNVKGQVIRVIPYGLTQTGSPAIPWNANTGFNAVLEYLRERIAGITKTGAPAPTDIVLAWDVGNVLIKIFSPDAKTSHLSQFKVERGEITLRTVEPGVSYLGNFIELGGADVWIYSGTYKDLDGTVKPYVPSGKLLMLSQNARYDMNYGAIQNFYGNFAAVSRFPHSWIEQDGRGRTLQLESAPLFVPHQIDSVGVYDVLEAA